MSLITLILKIVILVSNTNTKHIKNSFLYKFKTNSNFAHFNIYIDIHSLLCRSARRHSSRKFRNPVPHRRMFYGVFRHWRCNASRFIRW